MTTATEIAKRYMASFFGHTPLESMAAILAENLIFEGPFHRSVGAKTYLEALSEHPPINVSFEMEKIFENKNTVCFIYQFIKPRVKTRMVQTFEVYDGKISKIILVFDTKAFA